MASPPAADEQDFSSTVDGLLSMLTFQSEALKLAISEGHYDHESLVSSLLSTNNDDNASNSYQLDFPYIKQEDFESLLPHLPPKEINNLSSDHFNFEAVMDHFFNCAKHHNRTKEEMLMDIFDIVIIGLRRGDVRKDQLVKTDPIGAKRIMELANWYKIPIRSAVSETIPLRTGTLTFVRAVSCFPDTASSILYQSVGSAKNGAKTVLASEQLPDAMKHSGFPGLIPKGCDPYIMKAYSFAHAAYMVDFGSLINPNDKRSLKEMCLSQLDYCKAAIENEKSSNADEDRANILGVVGLTDCDVFKKIVDVCNNLCKVVGEPEISFETAVKYHIKNNVICFFEDESKDVAAAAGGEEAKNLADKLEITSIHDFSTFLN